MFVPVSYTRPSSHIRPTYVSLYPVCKAYLQYASWLRTSFFADLPQRNNNCCQYHKKDHKISGLSSNLRKGYDTWYTRRTKIRDRRAQRAPHSSHTTQDTPESLKKLGTTGKHAAERSLQQVRHQGLRCGRRAGHAHVPRLDADLSRPSEKRAGTYDSSSSS